MTASPSAARETASVKESPLGSNHDKPATIVQASRMAVPIESQQIR
jgi:hypothetical protein